MSARILLILISFIGIIISSVKMYIDNVQMKRPLPEEVADVYDKERYQTFLAYEAEYKKVRVYAGIALFIVEAVLIMSDLYIWMEKLCNGNVYGIVICTFIVFHVLEIIIDVIIGYHITFRIEEKYGLNKKNKKEFAKDIITNEVVTIIALPVLLLLVTFIGNNLQVWTANFSITYVQAIIFAATMYLLFKVMLLLLKLLSFFAMRAKYTYTELENEEWLAEINRLQAGVKRKFKKIYIYDESKKTTEKNAYCLKLLWYREFGIADNFVNENAERELLAVLSHEIGHLKHKKDIWNYINYFDRILIFLAITYLLANPELVFAFSEWVKMSFDITVTNYYVLILVFLFIFKPIKIVIDIFDNYVCRREEYEADQEAVKNGFGEELIATFKKMSSDELIDVNPHPILEFLDYDHPGMYNRIKRIKNK